MEETSDKDWSSDCREFLEILHLMLDNEATKEQVELLRAHLSKDEGCLQTYQLEKEIRMLIKEKLIMQPVPPDLVQNIRKKIFRSTQAYQKR